jgi:predicted HAD superfamily phosphohydrolase
MLDSIPILSTMAEKVAAYNAFFDSEDTHLVVIGVGGDAVGKTAALRRIKCHGELVVLLNNTEFRVYPADGLTEDAPDARWFSRIIFHLNCGDKALAEALQAKYNARVLRFARGSEA